MRLRQFSFHLIISDGVISKISVLLPTPSVWFARDRIVRSWLSPTYGSKNQEPEINTPCSNRKIEIGKIGIRTSLSVFYENWKLKIEYWYKILIFVFESTAGGPSMSNTPKLSRFVWSTLRFDSIRTLRLDWIRTESRLANRLPAWRIDNRGNDSCRFLKFCIFYHITRHSYHRMCQKNSNWTSCRTIQELIVLVISNRPRWLPEWYFTRSNYYY